MMVGDGWVGARVLGCGHMMGMVTAGRLAAAAAWALGLWRVRRNDNREKSKTGYE